MKTGLKRSEHSNAIINTDVAALNKYKQERKLHRMVAKLSDEIEEIKATMARIDNRVNKIENQ